MSTDDEEKLENMMLPQSHARAQLSNRKECPSQKWSKKRKCSIAFVYSSFSPATSTAKEKHESTSQPSKQPNNTKENNPRNWSKKRKYPLAFFALLSAFVATIGTPLYFAAIPSIASTFSINSTLAIASEIYGRKIVYQISIPLSLIFTLLGGFASNFPMIAAARFLAGLFAGPCTTVGAGVLNDLWDAGERTGYVFAALFSLAVMSATAVGAMASSCILASHGWRWTFWVAGFLTAGLAWMVVFVPETRGNRLDEEEGGRKEGRRGWKLLMVCVSRPLHMILTEPLILPSGLVVSITQSILFAYYVIYYILFKDVYGFDEYQVGMAFSPVLVGMVLAAPVVALFDRLTYQKARKLAVNSRVAVLPETRLYPTMLGVILQPISLFLGIPDYNNEVYRTHFGASALAATSFMRFTVSSAFPLFTARMVSRLGFAWATSLLGFITVAMIPIPWVFFKWGPVLRSKSRYLKV